MLEREEGKKNTIKSDCYLDNRNEREGRKVGSNPVLYRKTSTTINDYRESRKSSDWTT
jgi:hypothetical protein